MRFISHLKQGVNFFLDLIFPIECLGCGNESRLLCEKCFQTIPINNQSSCPICQRPSNNGRLCFLCRGESWLDGVLVAGDYNNLILQRAIKTFKYHYVGDLAKPLSRLLKERLRRVESLGSLGADFIIPVPLHKKKFLERGFNQSALLVKELALEVPSESLLPTTNILKRRRPTPPQVNLQGKQRQENIKGAFVCLDAGRIKNKNIILVDDVLTTGATLQECAQVLKIAGAKEVWGLVLAKG